MLNKIISKFITKSVLFTNNKSYVKIAKMSQILSKSDAKDIILIAKRESNLTFKQMANKLELNKVWLTSAIFGEQPFDEEIAIKTLQLIGINEKQNPEFKQLVNTMKQIPEIRGLNHGIYSTDPLVSRLYEVLRVYGPTLRALVTEECGNGIVSAIDCKLECHKYVNKNSGSERVVIKIDGKFLKYFGLK